MPRETGGVGIRDHLRVCGADSDSNGTRTDGLGSSPRVRSRHHDTDSQAVAEGIISACAEQTRSAHCSASRLRDHLRVCGADAPGETESEQHGGDEDHLRVCGADALPELEDLLERGSSPRVRSRLCGDDRDDAGFGIISACAEQTENIQITLKMLGDHLRVCGADLPALVLMTGAGGSSPRVRSRQIPPPAMTVATGIISACAEQTPLTR